MALPLGPPLRLPLRVIYFYFCFQNLKHLSKQVIHRKCEAFLKFVSFVKQQKVTQIQPFLRSKRLNS